MLTNEQRSSDYFKAVSGHVAFSCFSCYTSSLAKKCKLDLFRKDTRFPVVELEPVQSCICPFRMPWRRSTGRGPLPSTHAVSAVKLPRVGHIHYTYSEADAAGNCRARAYRRSVCSGAPIHPDQLVRGL